MRLRFLALLLPLAVSPAAPAPAAPAPARQPTLCRPAETALYSCRFGRDIGSLCLTRTGVRYRYGRPGRPSLDLANAPDWSNVHVGGVVGGGHGYQRHLRLSRGDYQYVVHQGQAGELTDIPGQTFSGIAVLRGEADVASRACKGRPLLRADWEERLLARIPAAARERVLAEDEAFDRWY